jgi:hypothetical protein
MAINALILINVLPNLLHVQIPARMIKQNKLLMKRRIIPVKIALGKRISELENVEELNSSNSAHQA